MFFKRLVFFVGWMLSPFTFWNDAFVNIPLAYLCANIFVRIWRSDFLIAMVAFYWISNGLGILMMYISGKSIFTDKGSVVRELFKLVITLAIYSMALVLLYKAGILKPL